MQDGSFVKELFAQDALKGEKREVVNICELENIRFNDRLLEWRSLDLDVVDEIPKDLKGVYLIRTNKTFSRLLGSCSILYIGQGKLEDRLWCLADLSPQKNYMHTARNRIINYLKRIHGNLEFACIPTENKEKAKSLEKELLEKCRETHMEAPPFNHQL